MSQPTNAQKYFQLGQKAYTESKYDEAIAQFQKSIDIDSNNADAYYWLGRAFSELGNNDKAIASFEQCVQVKSDYADAYYEWGTILSLTNRDNEAAKKFAKCIRNDPNNALAYYQLGKIFYRANKHRKAITKFQKYIALRPDYPDTYYDLGRILWDLKRHNEAIAYFEQCIQIKPDYADAYYWLGLFLYELGKKDSDSGRYDKADGEYEEAYYKFTQSIELNSIYKADAYYYQGCINDYLGKYNEAINSYEQCIQIKPDYADAYYWLGKALYSLKEDRQAADKLAQSIELDSTYKADAYYWWGNALYSLRRYEEAADKLAQSIELNSSYQANAYHEWGKALYLLNRYDEAAKKFEKSIDLNSSYQADAYYLWGMALSSLAIDLEQINFKKVDAEKLKVKAQEKFIKCTKVDSQYAPAYYQLGNIFYGENKYTEAAEKFNQCIAVQPNNYPEAYYWLASAYAWLRKYEEAARQYAKFIEKYERFIQENPETNNPYYIDAHYWLGKAYYYLGENEKAVEHLEIFIEKYKQLEIEKEEVEIEKQVDIDKVIEQLKDEYFYSYYWLGLALYIKKEIPEAEIAFQNFLNYNSPNIDDSYADLDSLSTSIKKLNKYLDLGQGFIEIRKYDRAINYYEQAIEQLNKIESLFKDIKSQPEYFQNRIVAEYYLALALEQQKKYDLAIEKYKQIIELFEVKRNEAIESSKEDENSSNNYLTSSYFRIGFILANKKIYDRAIEYLEQAKQCGTNSAYIHEKLADIYRQQGDYQRNWQELEKSIAEYEKEIVQKEKQYQPGLTQINPNFIADYWHNSLGNIYYQFLHKYDRAEDIYLKGLKLDPNNKNILISLTNLYLRIIQDEPKNQDEINQNCIYYSEATKYFNKALKILENTKNRLGDSPSLIDLGNFLLRTKKIATKEQYSEIENYFLKAIEKDPNAVDAYAGLGVFYFEQEKLNKAVENFKKAHEHELGDFNIWSNLAETYLKQNKLDRAEKEFKDLLAINPYHVDSNIGLGQVYVAMGDAGETEMYHQAIDCFTKIRNNLEHDRGSRKLNSSELANLFYLQGYANFQIYQKSDILQRRDSFWRSALDDFNNALKQNRSHNYARRAMEKIKGNISMSSGSTLKEEISSYLLTALSLVMLAGSQILCFWELPQPDKNNDNQKTEIEMPIYTVSYQSTIQNKTVNRVVPQTANQVEPSQIDKEDNKTQNPEKEDNYQQTLLKFGSPGHIILTFGSFILTVIFLYLPRITRLSVGQKGVELEKSPLRQISIGNLGISNLRISRPVADRVNPDRSPRLRL